MGGNALRLLARLIALSQRFDVTTDSYIGTDWAMGDLRFSIARDYIIISKGSYENGISVKFTYDEILMKDCDVAKSSYSFYMKLGDFSSLHVFLKKLDPSVMQSEDFKTVDYIFDNFADSDVLEELSKDNDYEFDMLKAMVDMDLKQIDRQLQS